MDQTPNSQLPDEPTADPVISPENNVPTVEPHPTEDLYRQVRETVQSNKDKRTHAFMIGVSLIGVGAVVILILTSMGMSLNTYSEVSKLSNIASIIGLGMAITSGVVIAYATAHPTKLVNSNEKQSINWMGVLLVLAILGFGLYIIPGLVLLLLYFNLKKKNAAKQAVDTDTGHLIVKPVNAVIIIFSFFLGAIPGLILSITLTYSLSNRACELSGSKYC